MARLQTGKLKQKKQIYQVFLLASEHIGCLLASNTIGNGLVAVPWQLDSADLVDPRIKAQM